MDRKNRQVNRKAVKAVEAKAHQHRNDDIAEVRQTVKNRRKNQDHPGTTKVVLHLLSPFNYLF